MTTLLRHGVLLALAAVFSWWVILYAPRSVPASRPEPILPPVTITPRFEPVRSTPVTSGKRAPSPAKPAKPAAESARPESGAAPVAPPPAELGAPEGIDTPEAVAAERVPEPEAKPDTKPKPEPKPVAAEAARQPPKPVSKTGPSAEVARLMKDEGLLRQARAELTGKVRKGFATVLLAAPEDQIHIARFFGEELVLVPRSALDPKRSNPVWFRVAAGAKPTIEKVRERPPLERYRQYRDLFDYEYNRLPPPLRTLRKSVLLRSEVYLFAALIPASEWAAVIGRRAAAIAGTGRRMDQVRRVVMQYVGSSERGYDIVVHEIVFADGSRIQPDKLREKQP